MKFKIGIIGSGAMGSRHTYGYNKIIECFNDVELEKTVMCSRNITKQRAEDLGWSEVEQDWEKVVARKDINVIDISVYDNLHYPIAKAALENGKHVLCEKPLAISYEQAQELTELSKKSGSFSVVCFNKRYIHSIRTMKHLIDSGEIGEIRHVYSSYTMNIAIDPQSPMHWRLDDKISPAGVLGDLGSHIIDLCRFFGLEFSQVCGFSEVFGKLRPQGNLMVSTTASELCTFNARFTNNALGVFETSRVSGGDNGGGLIFEIHGTKGNIRWEKSTMRDLLVCVPDKMSDQGGYLRIKSKDILAYDYPWDHEFMTLDSFTLIFHDLLTKQNTAPSFSDGAECCKIIDSILQSNEKMNYITI